MAHVRAWHWEHGEEHTDWTNIASNPPVTDEVSSVSPLGGAFSKRLVFGNNDNYQVEVVDVVARSAGGDAVSLSGWIQVTDYAEFDEFNIATQSGATAGGSFTGFNIAQNGSGALRAAANMPGLDGGPALAGFPPGTFQDGVKHKFCLRVIHDGSTGVAKLTVDGATVAEATGVDTFGGTGSPTTGSGMGLYMSTNSSGVVSGEVRLDDFVLSIEEADTHEPMVHEVLVPTGVTADDDGVEFGGAATAHEALDEIPGTSADGINLNTVGHIQGLTYPSRAGTGTIRTVQAWGQVGDSAAGSETVECRIGDGTAETANFGPIALNATFASQRLSELLNAPPSGGSWDDTLLDATYLEIERTA